MFKQIEKKSFSCVFCTLLALSIWYSVFLFAEEVSDSINASLRFSEEVSDSINASLRFSEEVADSINASLRFSEEVADSLDASVHSLEVSIQDMDSLSYEADMLYYFVDENKILLTGNALVIYHTSIIKADSISIDFDRNQALAMGRITMEDREYLIIGHSANYDIETETGIVIAGASRFEQGFYYGEEIRKVGDDVFDLDHGCFTTCDALHPHFDIRAWDMRIYRDDVLVGRPVVFYVNEFPILALPFGAFSIRSGRRSGFLMPVPGYSQREGKKIKDLGYYYVINDYSDITLSMEFKEKTGHDILAEFIYLDRYKYSGKLDAGYKYRQISPFRYTDDWSVRYRHFQNLPQRATFDVDIDFITRREMWENEVDVNKRLQERITSRISWRKPLNTSSIVALASYTDDFVTGNKSITLPNFSYSLPTRPIHEFFPFIPDDVRRGDHWWKSFSLSWSAAGTHQGTVNAENPTLSQILWENTKDEEGNYISLHNAGIRQSISLSHNATVLGWLRLNNSLNYQDALFDRDREGNLFAHGHSYGFNSSASFNIYGVQRYNSGPIVAARHIVTPRANFRYSPDFSHNRDKYFSFGGINVSSANKIMNLDLNLEQKWQFRLTPDKNEQERRLNDLFVLRSSSSYNFEAKEKPWNDINHSFTINPGSYEIHGVRFGTNQSVSATQSTYKNFEVSSWRMNVGLNLSGNSTYYDYFPVQQNDFVTNNLFRTETDVVDEQPILSIQDLERLENPGSWSLNSSFDYSFHRISGNKSQRLSNTASLKITQNWTVKYGNTYDFVRQMMMQQTVSIDRDLHCCGISLTYSQSGDVWEFSLNLFNVRLPSTLRLPYSDRSR